MDMVIRLLENEYSVAMGNNKVNSKTFFHSSIFIKFCHITTFITEGGRAKETQKSRYKPLKREVPIKHCEPPS
ncbi:hypothetical protein RSOLAG1IB_01242 [Rhizoctonia solani AG-1 IB]|uniref:Uncharacterized protein n=1 Tax=Thanatephorus cucumeris (strain AG1-IB / isolate 7/3/14) TaxID=1108050 RepID=A0A0B7FGA4_THACB|nr:hypothetical protein RSOLAG1IB_01242 [Rhizoctonia solani AG-1 IB]